MMNKVKSARVHLIRFLFVLPVLAVIILAFRNASQNNLPQLSQVRVTDTIPDKVIVSDDEAPVPPLTPVPDIAPPHGRHRPMPAPHAMPYPDLNDCINSKGYCITIADNRGECVVIVKDKNKKIVEAVALTDWNKDKTYEEKYGEIPPPPPPPKPPVIVRPGIPSKPGAPLAKPMPDNPDLAPVEVEGHPIPPKPPAPAKLPKGVSSIQINNKNATVIMKDGTIEKYDLNKPEERASFEKKFGRPVAAPDKNEQQS